MKYCRNTAAHGTTHLPTRLALGLAIISTLLLISLTAIPVYAEKTQKSDVLVSSVIEKIKQTTSLETLTRIAAILDEDKGISQSVLTRQELAPARASSGQYTSLIVDARGLGVLPCISPKILKPDGSEVWGTMGVTPDFAIETGIASFVTTMEDAMQNKRCGKHPLIIKAQGALHCSSMQQPCVSNEDAALIISENAKSKFADHCNVIFVIDR